MATDLDAVDVNGTHGCAAFHDVAVGNDNVRILADFNRTDSVLYAQMSGWIDGDCLQCGKWIHALLDGKPRQLHLEQAKAAVDYKVYPEGYRTPYEPMQDEEVVLVSCPYFTTSVLDLTLPDAKDLSQLDSVLTVMCLSGSGSLEVDGESVDIQQGETVLIPADADDVCFIPVTPMKLIMSHL